MLCAALKSYEISYEQMKGTSVLKVQPNNWPIHLKVGIITDIRNYYRYYVETVSNVLYHIEFLKQKNKIFREMATFHMVSTVHLQSFCFKS